MIDIIYSKLSSENFNEHSLDAFVRMQTAQEVWLPQSGEWILTPVDPPKVWDWSLEKRRQTAKTVVDGLGSSGFAYGAFLEGRVVGYIYITGELWGSQNQYTELKLYHISAPYRKMGIGRELFALACAEARARGARKLYISANNSKESQEAYRKLGCIPAQEINLACADREPFDIQMEYPL